MGKLQSIFFRPVRGFRKYEEGVESVVYSSLGREVRTSRTPSSELYQLDGVINEQHSSNVKVTKHPVEYGVDISDHVIKQPMKVIVNGIVTNSPSLKQISNRLPGDASFVNKLKSVAIGSRVRDAYAGLVQLQNERLPVRLQTGLLVYDNMILTSISAPNDIEGNLKVKLTFEEVFIADGSERGLTQAITNKVTEVDYATVAESLLSVGLSFLPPVVSI